MSRTIVITGATGFIGGVLAKRLSSSTDWQIRALVRSSSSHKRPKDINAEWVTGDLEDSEGLERLVAGADAVVHCAGAVRGAGAADFDRINVAGTARLVQAAAKQHPSPRFLLLSSLAAREPQLSHYAASKFNGEKVIAQYSGNMFWGILRPPAVYGPGDREMRPLFQWMFRGLAPLIGSDSNRVSLLYAEDLAKAIVCWLDKGQHSQRIYELHDGHPGGYSWQEIIGVVERLRGKSIVKANIPVPLVQMVSSLNLMGAKLFGGSPMLTPGKVKELTHPDWVADNTRMTSEIGWLPDFSLEDGLRQTFSLDV
jgi:nucleoside-diphosphate-sugar epimerase